MQQSLRIVVACATAFFVFAPSASAAVKAKASLVRSADALVLEVGITSSKAFTAATRPRGVKVGSVSLKRVSSSAKAMTWRSSPARGAAATRLESLAGKRAAIRVSLRGGKSKTLKASVAPAPAATPPATTPPATGTPAPGAPAVPGAPVLTRNDAAGQSVMTGDLLLEFASFGNVSAEYRRIWLMGDGTFRLEILDWMQQTGEKCRSAAIIGTWAFKEGYTTDAKGGGVVVKIGITSPSATGDEVLAFGNAEPGAVYVGPQGVRYERNPNMRATC